jgi:hypothetical protein
VIRKINQPVKIISIIKTEAMVDIDLENLNLFSRKLATGKKSIAIKNARKNGAKILCPNERGSPIR